MLRFPWEQQPESMRSNATGTGPPKWVKPTKDRELSMKIDTANAEAMGSLICEGGHKPFHALACPLRPSSVRIGKKR